MSATTATTSRSRAFKVRSAGANETALAHADTVTLRHDERLVPVQAAQSAGHPTHHGVGYDLQPDTSGVMNIAIERLAANPANARRLVSATALDELAANMQSLGQLNAVLVFFDEHRQPTLIDGHRRVAGGKQLGWTHIRCEIRPAPASLRDLYLYSRTANAQHEAQSALDDALVWRDLLNKKVYASQAALAQAIGEQEATVSKTLALVDIPRTLMLLLVERPHLLSLRMLSAIRGVAKLRGVKDAEELLLEIDRRGLSARQVEKRLSRLEAGPAPRARANRHAFSWGGVAGEMRRFDKVGRIELSIQDLEPAALQALEDALLKVLAGQTSS